MKWLVAGALALGTVTAAGAAPYTPKGTCGAFPKVDVAVPAGYCMALVADNTRGLRFPRRIVELAPNRFWIIDMGNWEPRQGRLLEMTLNEGAADPAERVRINTLASKLDRPLALVIGPDGKAYIGEAGRIWRTATTGPVVQEVVVDDLPSDGAHPLKEIAFGPNGRLFINVGSASDACRDDSGAQPAPCPEVEGAKPRAAVYEAVLGDGSPALKSLRPYATGLRNSVALAWVGGTLLQGENSIDYPEATQPPEELNVLHDGSRHGWPYCVGDRVPARGYEKANLCRNTEAPLQRWPAHAAPLQLLAVPAGNPSPWAGQVLVAWHGHRPTGQRVMAMKVDAKGVPAGTPVEVVGGWAASPDVRPKGAPTGLTVDRSGRLWIVEDRNKTVMLVQRESKQP